MKKEKIYHIYSGNNLIAHSLTAEEFYFKLIDGDLDFEDDIEIIQVSSPSYREASY